MSNPPRTLLLVDDDELSRDVLQLLAIDAGYAATIAANGAEALESLQNGTIPDIILTDMQMPGVSGDSLARLMRMACGTTTVLVAMSGSQPAPDALQSFDGFLLKPFTMDDLDALLAGVVRTPQAAPAPTQVLNETIYASLAQGMPAAQLRALYELCLDDADRRMGTMRLAAKARDSDAFTRAAHAIKGGCGMVGATELAALAGAMETEGLPLVDIEAPFVEFLAASLRLRRMLNAK